MKSAAEISAGVQSGDGGAQDAVDESVAAIRAHDETVGAFLEVFEDEARDEARRLDEQGSTGLLAGVPIGIKDLIATKVGRTTAASGMLARFESPYEATVVSKLREQGGIVLGKTNLDEFAMGASNEYSAVRPVRNPWDTSRVAGGSSGGSAAAVAAGEVPVALGTDTGGSIRLPASFCGVVGLKPTYGRVSRFGVISYASSFDQVGPIGRTVEDVALLLQALAGADSLDATSSQEPVLDYVGCCGRPIEGLRIGIPTEFFGEEINPAVATVVRQALLELENQGAQLVEVSLSLMHAAVPTYYLLVKSEASSNLARYDGVRYAAVDLNEELSLLERYVKARGDQFGPEVKRSILMGTYALSAGYVDAWYKQASRVRTLIRREFAELFKKVDVIAGPVALDTAFKVGEKSDDPLAMYLADLLTDPASVAGLPAMSVPCGFKDQLPVGLQLITPHFDEGTLFAVGSRYQAATDWHSKRASL